MTLKKLTIAALAMLFFMACASARKVPITLLHTTDVHGYMLPTTDYEGKENVGGMLRAASLIKQIREKNSNTLLLDCGDFLLGSPESIVSRGELSEITMEYLQYNAITVGNHEFDWGHKHLKTLRNRSHLPLLGGNISGMQSYRILEIDGIRIAVVGITTPGMPKWFRPEFLGGLQFKHSMDALRDIMPKVKAEKPDILILLAHQGHPAQGRQKFANELGEVAGMVREFDVILGGHTHRVVPEMMIKDALYAQAGYHAIWVGQVDLLYDTVKRKVIRKKGIMHHVDSSLDADPELSALLKEKLNKSQKKLSAQVGYAEDEFSIEPINPGISEVQQLISASIAETSKAEIVIHGLLSRENKLEKGEILERDLWRIIPYENHVVTAMLTVPDLRAILDENLNRRKKYSFMGVWGLQYEVDLDKPEGQRVFRLSFPDGNMLHARKRYKVAFNSFVAASGGERFVNLRNILDRPISRLNLTQLNTREALRQYIKKRGKISPQINAKVIFH